MSPFVLKVHHLEDKYQRNGKVSFMFVPEGEYRKFAQYRKEYFNKQDKLNNEHRNKYTHSKMYSQAIERLFNRIDIKRYTVDEITEMFDLDPILSDHGRYIHEAHTIYDLLRKRGLKAKQSGRSGYYSK